PRPGTPREPGRDRSGVLAADVPEDTASLAPSDGAGEPLQPEHRCGVGLVGDQVDERARPLDVTGGRVADLRPGQAALGIVGPAGGGALAVDVDVGPPRPGGALELAGCGVWVAHAGTIW